MKTAVVNKTEQLMLTWLNVIATLQSKA